MKGENIDELIHRAIDGIQTRKDNKDGLSGVPSGFLALDRVTSGWQNSELIIVAARPGMGKSAFVTSAMRNAAIDFKTPVAIFSLEMSSVQLVNRLISAESEIPIEKIKKGDLADYEWERMIHITKDLSDAPIYIDDTPEMELELLKEKCEKLVSEKGVKLIIVDYLQLMEVNRSEKAINREQEIACMTRKLKQLAKTLNVPIIALSQLSRAVETRGGDKRPQLSDLRDSGSIEQDADLVMFLYRPEYYGLDTDESGMPLNGLGEVIIAKHRNGSLDTVNLKFVGKFSKFTDWKRDANDGFGSFPNSNSNNNDFTITLPSKAIESEVDESPF